MLDFLDILHMNGRINDSRIARLLQADPIVPEPNNPQNFNRYTYVWNNPLNATDPSGFTGRRGGQSSFSRGVLYAFGAVVSYASMGTVNSLWAAGKFASAYAVATAAGYTTGYFMTGSGQGGLHGAYGAMIGMGAASAAGVVDGFLSAYLLNAASAGISAVLTGDSCGHGFKQAGAAMALNVFVPAGRGGFGFVRDVLVQGTVSAMTGGNLLMGR